jgi:uncharacterized protein YfaS (alpha-2-macroglobulin family)
MISAGFIKKLTHIKNGQCIKYKKFSFALHRLYLNNNSLKKSIIMDTDGDPASKKFSVTFLMAMLCTTIILFSCKSKQQWIDVDPAFSKYIDAYTSGIISKTSSIKIQLAAEVPTTHSAGEEISNNLFQLSPSVKGKAVWLDARTIEFKPEKNLKPDELYEVNFKLGKVADVPSKFAEFKYNVQTLRPSFKVEEQGLRSSGDKKKMTLVGRLETADVEQSPIVEKLVTASQSGRALKVNWQHNETAKEHNFIVENIQRGSAASEVQLHWDGKPLNASISHTRKVAVPTEGEFKVLRVVAMNDIQQYASIQFSDPLAVGQELKGLISISNQDEDISYSINGSEVKLFTGDKLDGNYSININAGIQNTWGAALDKNFASNVFFENRMPSVKIHGRGNILPTSGRLVLPFEAINLKAVDISIIKIYENNIPQFLQTNDMGSNEDLRRVAKPIVQKTVRLDDDKTLDLHRKQRFSLDIDKFIKTEPGAIYNVVIGFRPDYSLFTCDSIASAGTTGDEEEEEYRIYNASYTTQDDDEEFWERYNDYYPFGYDWSQRENPCSKSYYNKDRWDSRNILASNIGLTAKRGSNNSVTVAVTSILSAAPLQGVELEVLDYQQQIIARGKSEGDGFATLDCKRKPYLLVAKKGSERGYLKLDDANSLALSRFDVAGVEIKNGIKGFLFGERGVWRPGDTMYINCIVEDKTGKLPADHPIEFNLFNPQGQLYKKLVQVNSAEGFNLFKVATSQNSPTGNWLATVKVGGASFEKRIKVETVMPNRLKINLDFGQNAVLGKNAGTTGNLNAKWLFGATAPNLKAKIDVALYAKKTSFPGLDGFVFDNPTASYTTQTKTIFDGSLDAAGNATIKPDFAIEQNAAGMLTANMLVKVFEPGGAFSVDNISLPYSPYNSYTGLKLPEGDKVWGFLLTNKTHTAQIVNVDNRGGLLSGEREVEVQFYKIQWRWWWDNSGDNLSNFTQDQYNKLIKKETVRVVNGKAAWTFKADNNEWGRYLILVKDVQSGHTSGEVIYLDEPGWQSRNNQDDPTAASMLSFTSGKEKYNVGEEVNITIPTSKSGRGLISIESGSRILKTFWVDTEQGQTVVKFKAEKEMAPNIYVNVSLLQPHAQTINDLPIRMYGVKPILIEDKNTILKPVISMANSIRPETKTSIAVSETNGKEMTYCIAIVDEGLLDLTRFKTPDPHAAFYAREALGVKSWDLFDYVIGAWGGDLERILTIGGDEGDGGPVKEKKANRFKPVVKYLGPFHLKKGGKATHNFMLPQYIGSVRAMVVAAHKGSYGAAEKTVAVKKPLMLLATVPRVLGPQETIKLPVTVFAMENNIKNVSVSLQQNELFEMVGPASKTISFSSPGEQMVYFDVKVKSVTGIGKIKFTASSGAEKTAYDIELDIRNPNPPVTSVTEMVLSPGQQWQGIVASIGNPATGSATMEVSSPPPINLQKRLNYLIDYPHGCIEQITSGVFPQLVLNQLTDLDEFRKANVERNIKAAIAKLQHYQTPEGGFGYWPGESSNDEWGSNYAGHFLLSAQSRGYQVSETLLQQWKIYQRNKASAWMPSTTNFYGGDLTQAYRLYLLALAKAPELGAMNRLKEFRYISPEAKWRLAAAYKLTGQDNIALQMINGLPTSFDTRPNPGFSFGSDTRDEAMVLETLTLLGKKPEAQKVVMALSAKLSSENWYSTQTTAYALIAIANYCGRNASGAKIIATQTIGGKTNNINTTTYFSQAAIDLKKGSSAVSLRNTGTNNLYVRVINKGQPIVGDSIRVNNNPAVLQMTVSYITKDNKPIDITRLKQGSDFVAKVSIKNPGGRGNYTQMAISQIFPGGWEILNPRMTDGEGSFKSSISDYQDIRDDRVYTYFSIPEKETRVYYIQLNASYPGRYFLPGVYCEAMYNNTISAGVSGKWIEVVNE